MSTASITTSRVVDQQTMEQQIKREATMEQFANSSLQIEIYKLIRETPNAFAAHVITYGFHYEFVETDNGIVCALSLRDGDRVWGDILIEVIDEKLLEKLRSVNGRYFFGGFPVFYHDSVRGRSYDFYRGSMANILQWIEGGEVSDGCEVSLVERDRWSKTCKGRVLHDPIYKERWYILLEPGVQK